MTRNMQKVGGSGAPNDHEVQPLFRQGLSNEFSSSAFYIRADKSSSVRRDGLEAEMIKMVESVEQSIAQNPENRVSRGLFDAELIDLDTDPNMPRRVLFYKPRDPGLKAFKPQYQIGFGTHLDEVVHKDVSRLLRRFPQRLQGQRQLNILVTDGIFSPGSVGGEDRSAAIKPLMEEVIKIANQFGGVTSSPIVFFYVGIGHTWEHHVEMAVERYGIPIEWIGWRPNTPQGVREASQSIRKSLQMLEEDGTTQSQFGYPNEDSHQETQFGF